MPTYNQLKFEQRQIIQSIEEYAKNIKSACDMYVNDKKQWDTDVDLFGLFNNLMGNNHVLTNLIQKLGDNLK